VALARAAGWPLLADPLSGLRFGAPADQVLGAYDAYAGALREGSALEPEVVVRVGAAPTSDPLLQAIEACGPETVLLDDDPGWREPLHLPGHRLVADATLACAALAAAAKPAPAAWREAWTRAEGAAREALAQQVHLRFFEASAVVAATELLSDGSTLVVSSSLPVRDLDRFAPPAPKRLRVLANRGASGIDGVTSTALGVAAARAREPRAWPGPMLLLTGDVAFLHDLPGLLALKRLRLDATIVVINNDGGRIFEGLPAAAHDPPFRDLFLTPHGLDLEPAARLVGARFARAEDAKGFREELARGLAEKGPRILEAKVDPVTAREARAAASRAALDAATRAAGAR
jgi:2-succinyl-5-enolpyruvyl-6-hydroxy-3-cyclohexene-1-carboxylate synthase